MRRYILILLVLSSLIFLNSCSKREIPQQGTIKYKMDYPSDSRSKVNETTVDGYFVLDPDKPQEIAIGNFISIYKDNEYILTPLDRKLYIRVINVGNQRAGFASFLFKGSLILRNTWSIKTVLSNPKWNSRIAKLDTTSRFKKVHLDSVATLYTTDGMADGKIEIVFFEDTIIPLVQNRRK